MWTPIQAALLLALAFGAGDGAAKDPGEMCPLLVGAEAPDVQVRDIQSDEVRLRNVFRERPTVLVFYRGGWCPYCTTHLAALGQVEPELREMGFQIVAVSPDRPAKLRESVAGEDLTYTLFSDSGMEAAQAFGVAFEVGAATVEAYVSFGIDLEDASGEAHHQLPAPSVFVLGTDSVIRFQYVNPDYKVRLDPDVLLAAAGFALRQE